MASNISGVAVRHPYCDIDLIELALAVPDRMAARSGMNRYIHRIALSGTLPDAIRLRSSKAEFSAYFSEFIVQSAKAADCETFQPIADIINVRRARKSLEAGFPSHFQRRFAWYALGMGAWLRYNNILC